MKRYFFVISVSLLAVSLLVPQPLLGQRPISPRAEQRLIREVRHELVMLPYYTAFDNLEYRVKGYEVTLMGQVTRPTLKSDAERAVKKIEGVERIVNRIEVLPLSPADDRIRVRVYYALFSQNSPLMRYGLGAAPSIHIIVKNGRVSLVGVVDNTGDKAIATMRTKSVSGIFSVENHLKVGKS
jgi:hyperosmotically inducible protein